MLTPGGRDRRRRTSVEEAEADYFASVAEILDTESPERAAILRRPFGFANATWEALKAEMRPGDELWAFCSDRTSWRALAGRAGLELVRDGEPIAWLLTELN